MVCIMYSNSTEPESVLAMAYPDAQHSIHYSRPTTIFAAVAASIFTVVGVTGGQNRKLIPYLFIKHARNISLFIFLPVSSPRQISNIWATEGSFYRFSFCQWKHINGDRNNFNCISLYIINFKETKWSKNLLL